jgi:phytoene dehydrogenase-like protein
LNKKKVVIVGAGHNGLIAGCYLGRAGWEVLVLESSDKPGGGSRTEERFPGYFFDMHSVAHNIINMTTIPHELELAGAGLNYIEMNPFTVAVRGNGQFVRFYRSVEATVRSIAEIDREEAARYGEFIETALPIIRTVLTSITRPETSSGPFPYLKRLPDLFRILKNGPLKGARDLASPYQSLLHRQLQSNLTQGPVSAYAAHGGVSPVTPGTGLFGFWQAAFHLYGQWHAEGGAVGLTNALVKRLESFGGKVRCAAPVSRIEAPGGQIKAVRLESGERIETGYVITAIHPKVALLELLDPALTDPARKEIEAVRTSNVVQALVHVATDRLPPYPGARPEDYHGLQSFVDNQEDVGQGFIQAEAGLLPDRLPLYAFTASAIDPTLAPDGHHTVYLACPSAPGRIQGGWENRREEFIERCLTVVEEKAPGFRQSIIGVKAYTPDEMEKQNRWPLGHPMHIDITLDQLAFFRPTPGLAGHRGPAKGLYISGAGTSPVGGIAGVPGRAAAKALLADWEKAS